MTNNVEESQSNCINIKTTMRRVTKAGKDINVIKMSLNSCALVKKIIQSELEYIPYIDMEICFLRK